MNEFYLLLNWSVNSKILNNNVVPNIVSLETMTHLSDDPDGLTTGTHPDNALRLICK